MNRHAPRYRHIHEDWRIDRLDEFLKTQYGFDLYDFSYSLAIILSKKPPLRFWHIWAIKKESVPHFRNFNQELRRMENLRNRIIRDLGDHLDRIQYWDWITNRVNNPFCPPFFQRENIIGNLERINIQEEKNRITTRIYKLDETLDAEIEHIKRFLSIYRYPSGPPALPKTIISSLWAMILKDSTGIHNENITGLLNWFCRKLENTTYGRELNNSLEESSPGAEEISRFNSERRFGRYLDEDRRELFVFDYRIAVNRQKIFPLQIRFEEDEPKFYLLPETSESRLPLIIFPATLYQSS